MALWRSVHTQKYDFSGLRTGAAVGYSLRCHSGVLTSRLLRRRRSKPHKETICCGLKEGTHYQLPIRKAFQMAELHKNLINGEWVGSEGVENINPSNTAEVVGLYARATADETKQAIAAAKAAFPAWSRSGILERHAILSKASQEILARKAELGELLSREEGKTLPEGIGEVTRAAQIFDFFAGETLRLAGEVLPSVRPGVGVEITREPIG